MSDEFELTDENLTPSVNRRLTRNFSEQGSFGVRALS